MVLDMRFYVLPIDQGKTTFINFDHVAHITIQGTEIAFHFAGVETPMVVTKSPTTLALLGKGMDVSDATKDQIANL